MERPNGHLGGGKPYRGDWLEKMKEQNPEEFERLQKLREEDPEAFREEMRSRIKERFDGMMYPRGSRSSGFRNTSKCSMGTVRPKNAAMPSPGASRTPRSASSAFAASIIFGWCVQLSSLPRRIARVRFAGDPAEGGQSVHAVVRPHGEGGQFDSQVVDGDGRVLVDLQGYESIEYPGAVEETLHAPFRTAMVRE